jgi:hypothetical protein
MVRIVLAAGAMKKTLCSLILTVLAVHPVGAVVLGQSETFADPDHDWVIGIGPGPAVPAPLPLALGGPAGPTDPYLSIVSFGGDGPRSRLSAQNLVDWTGNYIAAGVNAIHMDVNNLGTADVFLRLLFLEFGPMGPVSGAFTSNAIVIPAGSGWHAIAFDIAPGALTPLPFLPITSVVSTLSNAGELRLFHNPAAFFAPAANPPVVATLGVDNIVAAQSVPEPAAWVLLLSGLLAAGLVRGRRG